MKTKDLFRGVMMSLCAVVLATMTSCNFVNKNEPSDPSTKPSDPSGTEDASMTVQNFYSFPTTQEMLDLFYIKVEYLDGNGKMQTVTLDDDAWGINFKSNKLPAKYGMRVNITMKGTADLTKYQKVNISYTFSTISRLLDAQGKKAGEDHKHIVDAEMEMAPNKVSEWVENYKKHPAEFWYEYDAKGNYKETN